MRLSSLVVAVVFLFSSAVFSQHSSTSSAPSTPPPSPPPSAAPSSPAHTPPPSPSPSISSSPAPSVPASPTMSHNSAPSSPTPATSPVSHTAPMPSSAAGHASGAPSLNGGELRTASPVRPPNSGNEGRIVGSPRIGEVQPTKEKEKEHKGAEPDLRRRICANGACKEPQPNPGESDLRRRICKDGPCPCPAGQSAGKNGNCVSASAPANTASACQPNETWNGNACMAGNRCQPGQSWNGFECQNPGECATFSSRGSLLAMDARGIHRDMDAACNQDPYGQECLRLGQSYDSAVLSYEMLLNEAPTSCRTLLPDPISL